MKAPLSMLYSSTISSDFFVCRKAGCCTGAGFCSGSAGAVVVVAPALLAKGLVPPPLKRELFGFVVSGVVGLAPVDAT